MLSSAILTCWTHLQHKQHVGSAPTPDVVSIILQCVLADAGFKHDIAITLNAANAVQGVEVRPHVPVGYSGCKSPAAPVTLPSELKASRVIVITPEEAAPIPVIPGGKGVPFPGQPELSDAEVLALSSEGLDAEGKAALEAQMRSQGLAGKTGEKAEPSFFQKVRRRRRGRVFGAGVLLTPVHIPGHATSRSPAPCRYPSPHSAHPNSLLLTPPAVLALPAAGVRPPADEQGRRRRIRGPGAGAGHARGGGTCRRRSGWRELAGDLAWGAQRYHLLKRFKYNSGTVVVHINTVLQGT